MSSNSNQQEEEEDEELLIPTLPNDLSIQCIARVPKSHHHNLSLVSKSWHSTLLSPHFHATRHALNSTQSFLIINLRLYNPKDSTFSFQWYELDPSSILAISSNSNTYPPHIYPIKPCPSQPIGASFVTCGSHLYVIGGSINDFACNTIWVFDFVSNKWFSGPKMRVGREFAASGVINGKVYVLGGCLVDNWARSMNWAEVFDPGSSSWGSIPSPVEVREKWMHASAVVEGKLFAMADRGGVVFDPEREEWGPVSTQLDLGWRGRAAVVDEMLYCYDYLGRIRGFDFGVNVWKELKGVDKGLPKFLCGATMANVGGRLMVVWEEKEKGGRNASGRGNGKVIEVNCAEIVVKMVENGDLWGSILWSNVIMTVPAGSSIVHCLSVNL